MTGQTRAEKLRNRLVMALEPLSLELFDDSEKHAGHKGNVQGGGHFTVRIVSAAFEGKNLIQRHRLVYDAVGDMMEREIHALSIEAKAPGEE